MWQPCLRVSEYCSLTVNHVRVGVSCVSCVNVNEVLLNFNRHEQWEVCACVSRLLYWGAHTWSSAPGTTCVCVCKVICVIVFRVCLRAHTTVEMTYPNWQMFCHQMRTARGRALDIEMRALGIYCFLTEYGNVFAVPYFRKYSTQKIMLVVGGGWHKKVCVCVCLCTFEVDTCDGASQIKTYCSLQRFEWECSIIRAAHEMWAKPAFKVEASRVNQSWPTTLQ